MWVIKEYLRLRIDEYGIAYSTTCHRYVIDPTHRYPDRKYWEAIAAVEQSRLDWEARMAFEKAFVGPCPPSLYSLRRVVPGLVETPTGVQPRTLHVMTKPKLIHDFGVQLT